MVTQRCNRCDEVYQDKVHWCIPYANWIAKGMFDFIARTIDTRTEYQQVAENVHALSGFSSCLGMSVALLTETSLKTLLVLDGYEVAKAKESQNNVWGHDLWTLYAKLCPNSKAQIDELYNGLLPPPFSVWKSPNSVESVLQKERHSFERWRYLADKHEAPPESNPYNLAAVAHAIYCLHVERTDLPTYPTENS